MVIFFKAFLLANFLLGKRLFFWYLYLQKALEKRPGNGYT
jgi:hypothetical protein